jgi:hypothetical protein
VTTPAQPPARGKKKQIAPTTAAIIVLGIALAAGAFLLYRRRNATSGATAAASPQPNNEDVAGQIATLQGEIGDLQSSAAQDEAAETGTGTSGGTTTTGTLAAPGLSVTPHAGGANFGWNTVPGASAYQLQVTGAGGKGTGTSHYDHVANATHASVNLNKGAYKARVRAGTSLASVAGTWSPYKSFTVGAAPKVKPPVVKGSGSSGSSGGGGESED